MNVDCKVQPFWGLQSIFKIKAFLDFKKIFENSQATGDNHRKELWIERTGVTDKFAYQAMGQAS